MKNLNLYILGVIAILFSACSTNQDLATLNEYDDIYYQGNRTVVASAASAAVNDNTLDGASDAERSYYQNAPFPETETTEQNDSANPDSDYYDEDYANRIDNFHRPNDGDYLYSNSQNTSPSLSMSLGYGMGSYGSGMNMGFSYGSPGYGHRPMGMYNSYYSSYYSPFNRSPWYSPYSVRPYGYGGYGSPFYYDPFYPSYGYGGYGGYGSYGGYGGYYPPYYGSGGIGGDYYGNSGGVVSTPRSNSGSVRPSRGGVITPNNTSGGGGGRNEVTPTSPDASDNVKRENATHKKTTTERPQQTELRGKDVQTREDLRGDVKARPSGTRDYNTTTRGEYTRPGTTRNDYIRTEQPVRQTRSTTPTRTTTPSRVVTPSRTPDTRTLSPATRSRSGNINPTNNRQPSRTGTPSQRNRSNTSPSRQQRNATPRQSTPSRSYSRPSAPTRSSGGSFGGGGGGTSSPSSTPSRGSRR